jgi:hypothetical protein
MELNIYPIVVPMADEEIPFDMRFSTSNGNTELCHATGNVLLDSSDPSDRWYEFIDSEGELHYGR